MNAASQEEGRGFNRALGFESPIGVSFFEVETIDVLIVRPDVDTALFNRGGRFDRALCFEGPEEGEGIGERAWGNAEQGGGTAEHWPSAGGREFGGRIS